jgi:hypothetical protein
MNVVGNDVIYTNNKRKIYIYIYIYIYIVYAMNKLLA